jgi:adenylate kinase
MRLLLMGPPGSGKGTQAALLSRRLGIPAISTGDIFRSNLAEKTELGLAAQAYMSRGEYVPDDLTDALVRDRLAASDCADGFLLDGYPRTLAQVTTLDAILEEQGTHLDAVLELSVDVDVLTLRLSERAGTEGRLDDTEEVIRHRQDVYAEQTAPLLALYDNRGLLVTVDGVGTVEDVSQRLAKSLPLGPSHDPSPAGS